MRYESDALGRALVYWLWAFLFFVIGLGSVLSRTASSAPWLTVVFRTVLLSVGAAALIVWSQILWREFRTLQTLTTLRGRNE